MAESVNTQMMGRASVTSQPVTPPPSEETCPREDRVTAARTSWCHILREVCGTKSNAI